VSNSKLTFSEVVRASNGTGDTENRLKDGKDTLRWDKTSSRLFTANLAMLLIGVLPYNLLHMLQQFFLVGDQIKRSMERIIERL